MTNHAEAYLKGIAAYEQAGDMESAREFASDFDTDLLRASIDHMVVSGEDLATIEKFHAKILELQAGTPLQIIRKAIAREYPATEHTELTDGKNARSPRYPSGIEAIDRETDGLYGLTVLGGESGVGKSLLATGSSLLAAMSGWRVCYGNAELKPSEISRRVGAFIGANSRGFLSKWHCIDLFHGATLEKFVHDAEARCHEKDEKILLVIDSLNSLVRKMGRVESGYFQAIDDICAFGETAVRKSNGRVGMLLVSELNKSGGIRGATSEYVCCLDVRMKHGDKQKDVTDVSTEKGREGGGWRDYGSYHPNPLTCSFDPLDEPEPPEPPTNYQEEPGAWET